MSTGQRKRFTGKASKEVTTRREQMCLWEGECWGREREEKGIPEKEKCKTA